MLTVVYFTSNREKPEFEKRVQKDILSKIDGIPLISVSHKPIDFGENICVGEMEPSTQNAIRQIQIGCRAAKTDYVCLAESDFIYPKEYFQFVPDRIDMAYIATPIYILWALKGKMKYFTPKKNNKYNTTLIAGRDALIHAIEIGLSDCGYWGTTDIHIDRILDNIPFQLFEMKIPAISFKTDENMHRKSPIATGTGCRELDGVGESHKLIRRYMG